MEVKRALVSTALAALVACGGSTPATSGSSAGASVAPSAAAASSAPAATTAASAPASAAASGPRFGDVVAAGRLAQYKVTYKITATGQLADVMNGEQTWYIKPPKARYDFKASFGGQATTMSFFTLPEGSFFCFAISGGTQCLAAGTGIGSPLDSNAAVATQQQMLANPGQFAGTFKENRTIAGQTGPCYSVTGTTLTAGTFCYSSSGLTLFSQYTASGSTITTEATNVSTTVPDSDFELPARPAGRP